MTSWFRRKLGLQESLSADAVEIDFSTSFQTMAGFGGSMAYYTNWVSEHPNKDRIYQTIFGELQPAILRFRNTFAMNDKGDAITSDMKIDALAFKAATHFLGYQPNVLLTSWSPPARLKECGQTRGGCKNNVIIRSADGTSYAYTEFALWWLDSVKAYEQLGVKVRYVSPQNEPGMLQMYTFTKEEMPRLLESRSCVLRVLLEWPSNC